MAGLPVVRPLVGVLAAVLLVGSSAACGESGDTAATPVRNAEPPPTEAEAPEPQPDPSGQMIVEYGDAESPEAQRGLQLMLDAQVLEELADDVSASFVLPVDVPVRGEQCDEANAYWSSSEQAMTICYEDADLSYTIFEEAGDPDPVASAIGAERATFFHELGHALIDLYDLPFTGREEDVADQLAAVLLLQPDDDGQLDPDDLFAAEAYARMFQGYSEQDGAGAEDFPFWDVHEYDLARMYNFQCWIYGADPDGNADMVDDDIVPEERADSCEDEFDRMSRAWGEMLEPYVRDE